MLRIRLRRVGKKGQAYYRMVVADQRAPRDGAFIESLGAYDPHANPPTSDLNGERAREWISKGAQPSDAAAKILKRAGILDGGAVAVAVAEAPAEAAAEAPVEAAVEAPAEAAAEAPVEAAAEAPAEAAAEAPAEAAAEAPAEAAVEAPAEAAVEAPAEAAPTSEGTGS